MVTSESFSADEPLLIIFLNWEILQKRDDNYKDVDSYMKNPGSNIWNRGAELSASAMNSDVCFKKASKEKLPEFEWELGNGGQGPLSHNTWQPVPLCAPKCSNLDIFILLLI